MKIASNVIYPIERGFHVVSGLAEHMRHLLSDMLIDGSSLYNLTVDKDGVSRTQVLYKPMSLSQLQAHGDCSVNPALRFLGPSSTHSEQCLAHCVELHSSADLRSQTAPRVKVKGPFSYTGIC